MKFKRPDEKLLELEDFSILAFLIVLVVLILSFSTEVIEPSPTNFEIALSLLMAAGLLGVTLLGIRTRRSSRMSIGWSRLVVTVQCGLSVAFAAVVAFRLVQLL